MRRQAQFSGRDDAPYDRARIRSGGVATRGRRAATPPARQAPPTNQARASRPRHRPPRRRGSFLGFVRTVLVLAAVVLVVGTVLIGIRAAAFNATVSTASFPSAALLGPMVGGDRLNVLMVGYGGGDHDGAYLADSIQILSVDPSTDTTTTIPIPRDLWVEGLTTFGQNVKVNEVFAIGEQRSGIDGAGALLAEVLSEVTGLGIGHWISIDFEGFREMVDAVGGVTVDNPTAFSWTANAAEHQAGWWRGHFDAGELHLDGEEALMYTRARFTSVTAESTDFARSARQTRVIGALRSKLGQGGVSSIVPGLQLMDAIEGRVRTDLSAIDLFLLSGHLSSDRRIELEEGIVLTATTNTIGQYILIPSDWTGPGGYGGLRSYLQRQLAAPVETPTDAP